MVPSKPYFSPICEKHSHGRDGGISLGRYKTDLVSRKPKPPPQLMGSPRHTFPHARTSCQAGAVHGAPSYLVRETFPPEDSHQGQASSRQAEGGGSAARLPDQSEGKREGGNRPRPARITQGSKECTKRHQGERTAHLPLWPPSSGRAWPIPSGRTSSPLSCFLPQRNGFSQVLHASD